LGRLNKKLLELKHSCEEESGGCRVMKDLEGLDTLLLRAAGAMQEFFENNRDHHLFEVLSDFYFSMRDMLAARERSDDGYLIYAALTGAEESPRHRGKNEMAADAAENRSSRPEAEKEMPESRSGDVTVRISCVSPARDLQTVMDKAVSSILFSATLLPIDYYRKLLSARENDPAVYAETPFLPAQRRILIGRGVSTLYKARGREMYERIAKYIHDTVTAQRGNYMVFFPSYKVMEDVLRVYRRGYDEPDVNWVVQGRGMGEMDREIFLENFYEDPRMTLVGFCVMGGIFAEGIDLIGSKLIGAVVVGTGLPQISPEREILRSYYDERGMDGFGYAYRIPGMNKVLQAAGRVIRTAEDKGVILLLDDRFLRREYAPLFPREWQDRRVVGIEELKEDLNDFWACR